MEATLEVATTKSDPIVRAGLEVDVREMVINRWGPMRIFKNLRDQFHIVVPMSVIAAYISAVPETERLPETGLDKRYRQEVRIDPVQEMQRVLREQSNRVEAALTCEDVTPGASKQVSAIVGQEIKTYFDMLEKFIGIAQSLGVLNKRPEEILATLRAQNPTLEELRNARMGRVLGEAEGAGDKHLLEIGFADDEASGSDTEEGSRLRLGNGEPCFEAEAAVPVG